MSTAQANQNTLLKDAHDQLRNWFKTLLGTVLGLISGALVMTLTPLVNSTIRPERPIANFETQIAGLTVTFNNRSLGGSKARWDFGDGSPLQFLPGDHKSVVHTYPRPGSYTAKLTVTNVLGEDNDRQVAVQVNAPKPVAVEQPEVLDLHVKPITGKPGQPLYAPATVCFAATVENAQFYVWDFGDDLGLHNGDAAQMTRTFSKPGKYRITVTAFNGKVRTDQRAEVVVIEPPPHSVTVALTVTTQAVQVQRVDRMATASGTRAISSQTGGQPIEQIVAARPGWKIVGFAESGSTTRNVTDISCTLAPDGTHVRVVGKTVAATQPDDAVMNVRLKLTEEKATATALKPERYEAALPMTGGPTATILKVPAPNGGLRDMKRSYQFEIYQGQRNLLREPRLPTDASVTIGGTAYRVTTTELTDGFGIRLHPEGR